MDIPTEEQEQAVLVEWLRLNDIPHWRTPNETYTKSWKQKRKNKMLGVSAGVPDLFCIVCNGQKLIAIEMKRQKGGVLSPAQKEWLGRLQTAGVDSFVARGAVEAIQIIKKVEKNT